MSEPTYVAGQVWYDAVSKGHVLDSGYSAVRVNAGREEHIEVYNDTVSTITNGTPVSVTGTVTSGFPNVVPSTSSVLLSVLGFAGVATMDIPAGGTGLVTSFGKVHDVNTSSFSVGFIYLSPSGSYTQTRPLFPEERLIIGGVLKVGTTDGIISVNPNHITRKEASRSYNFTSANIVLGQYYKAGFYEWAAASSVLNQTSPSTTFGLAGKTYAAHCGIVPLAAGVVDTGQVGLRIVGIRDYESGVQVAAQTGIITEDITTLTANTMVETVEKFSGQVTLEFYVVSGSPTSYSLTCNKGYSKYEDFANRDMTLTAFECHWRARKTDTNLNIEVLHHESAGWTYAATSFIPGSTPLFQKTTDQALAGDVVEGTDGAYKRSELTQFVDSGNSEGLLVRVTQVDNKDAIQSMDIHFVGFSEELN